MISLQNEPNYVVDYDGCSYASAADYRSVLIEMRHALDTRKLQSVRLGGSESAHPGDPVFFGVGTNFWQDVESVPLDDALTHTYGGAGWDHFQFSHAPRPKWMTEWCDIDKDDETHAAVKTAAHIARDLVNDGFEKWIFWNAYDSTTQTGGSANLVYGSATDPKTTKTFHVLKRLFREVTPDGSFKVRAFKSNDPVFETGLGKDFSKPVNVIGFKSPKKTVLIIANTSATPASIVLKGLSSAKLRRYETSAATPSEAEMDDKGIVPVTGGASAEFSVPAASVEILCDGEGGANLSGPSIARRNRKG
jgi:O-glycosyl hydrolase